MHLPLAFTALFAGWLLVSQPCAAADAIRTDAGHWRTYRSAKGGFEISFPRDGGVVEERESYVRVQNYVATDYSDGLKPSQFYLEIHFKPSSESCTGWQPRPRREVIGGVAVLTGRIPEEGDSGGDRFGLCVVRPDHVLAMAATENNKQLRLARRIIASLRFIK